MKTDLEKTQHYTVYKNKICNGLLGYIPEDAVLVEPFVGAGDLLSLFPTHRWEKYDCDPKIPDCVKQDTLINVPNYRGRYVITNPPYLAKNKAEDDLIYELYGLDDLYKIALKTTMQSEGGILIIPTNFFSDKASEKIRLEFLNQFEVKRINIFTEPVFDSTTYSICSFAFCRIDQPKDEQKVIIHKYPQDIEFDIKLQKEYGYRIGGEIFSTFSGITPMFGRLLKNKPVKGHITRINLTTIDTRKEPFHLSFGEKAFYGKNSDRTYATLTSVIRLSEEEQKIIVDRANEILTQVREKYRNLLFTNYRDFDRKRVEFDFIYRLLSYIYEKEIKILKKT